MTSRVPPGSCLSSSSLYPRCCRCLLPLRCLLWVCKPPASHSLYLLTGSKGPGSRHWVPAQWQPHLSSPNPVLTPLWQLQHPACCKLLSGISLRARGGGNVLMNTDRWPPIYLWSLRVGNPFPFDSSTLQRKTTTSAWGHYINQLSGAIDWDHLPLRTSLSLPRKKASVLTPNTSNRSPLSSLCPPAMHSSLRFQEFAQIPRPELFLRWTFRWVHFNSICASAQMKIY